MKNKNLLILAALFVMFLLAVCKKNKINDNYDKIIEYSSKPSYGAIEDCYKIHFLVKNNNTIEIYGSYYEYNLTLDYIEGIIIKITEEEKNKIIKTINRNHYKLIPKDVTSPSMDGSYHYIEIYNETGDIIKESHGLNPINIRFNNIRKSILNCISDEDIKMAHKKIKNTIIENIKNQEKL